MEEKEEKGANLGSFLNRKIIYPTKDSGDGPEEIPTNLFSSLQRHQDGKSVQHNFSSNTDSALPFPFLSFSQTIRWVSQKSFEVEQGLLSVHVLLYLCQEAKSKKDKKYFRDSIRFSTLPNKASLFLFLSLSL
jgi:hypothetical protein